MMGFLECHGLLEVEDGTKVRPAANSEEWDKLDKKARCLIGLSLESAQVRQVMNLRTSAEMWNRLESLYELKNATSKHLLLQKFFEYKMDNDSSVAQHVAKIEEMARQLEELGHKQEEVTLITKVLHSLPSSFRNLISAWDSVPEGEQTMKNLLPRLMKEELLNKGLTDLNLDDADTGNALYNKAKNKGRQNNSKKHSNKDQIYQKKFKGKCHGCGKYGHKRAECNSDKKTRNDSQTNTAVLSNESHAFTATGCLTTINWNNVWIADSGASHHMTPRKEWFVEFKPLAKGKVMVMLENGDLVSAQGIGKIKTKSVVEGQLETHTLFNSLYVPELTRNLFSIGAATERGAKAEFTKNKLLMKIKGKVRAIGHRIADRMYQMDIEVVINAIEANVATTQEESLELWHARLGHACMKTIREMAKNNAVIGMQCSNPAEMTVQTDHCEACILGKQCRKSFSSSMTRATKPGELIHFDICGPMSTQSIDGSSVMAVFVDDHSGMIFVKPLKSKADITDAVQDIITKVSAAGHKVKKLRSDNAKEFKSKDFRQIMRKYRIAQEFSTAYCPEQNGRIERQNRTIVEMARTMLAAAELPLSLWGKASNTAALIRNFLPLDRLDGRTPWEVWCGTKPNVGFLRVFGSKAYALIEDQQRNKFAPKSEQLVLVGYEPQQKAYRLWQSGTKRIVIRRNVEIIEPACRQLVIDVGVQSKLDLPNPTSGKELESTSNKVQTEESMKNAHTQGSTRDDIQRQQRKYEKRTWTQDPDGIATRTRTRTDCSHVKECGQSCIAYAMISEAGPPDVNEALNSPDAKQWENAMREEMKSLVRNETWELVELPPDRRAIKNKWIFQFKTKTDRRINRFKARLVVKGCSRKANVDYSETFSPVARFESIRILSIACVNDYEVSQFDIKTAFLYGDLKEEIFMEQPEGFNDGSGRVCKLRKSLYGLKQAPRQWNAKFDEFLQRFGLTSSQCDACVYVAPKETLYLALYVDDGLVIGKSIQTIQRFLDEMNKEFETTYSEATCYLGIEIERNREERNLRLHQSTYIHTLLKNFDMENCNPVGVPADPHQVLTSNIDEDENPGPGIDVPYRQLVGSLLYLAICTRTDISFAISALSQFLENPSDLHWKAAKRVLRYIAGTRIMGIEFNSSKTSNVLMAYSDADYGSCPETRKSISGVILTLNDGPIIWFARKQGVIATSIMDAKYIAAYEATKEIVCTRRILEELGVRQHEPTVLHCDNAAAEQLIKNPVFRRRTKHIDIKFHYTRDILKRGDLVVNHVASNEQLADILTKPLARERFEANRTKISLI